MYKKGKKELCSQSLEVNDLSHESHDVKSPIIDSETKTMDGKR
jgi:hypothetical protein